VYADKRPSQERVPVRRIETTPEAVDLDHWPAALPAVRHLLDHGLDLGPLTGSPA